MDAPSLTSTPALRCLLPLVMFLRIWEQDTWNSRTSDKILLMISCSVPPPLHLVVGSCATGAAKCQYRPADAALAPVFRSVFSVRLAPVSASSQTFCSGRARGRARGAAVGGEKGVADLADVRGGQRVGGHHAGDQALVVEFLCRYVPLSATIGPPGAGLRAVFRTRSSLIRFEGFTLMYRRVMSSPSSAPLKTAAQERWYE